MKCPSDVYNGADNHFLRSEFVDAPGYARGNYAMNTSTNNNCLNGFPNCQDGFSYEGTDLANNNRRVWGSGLGGANNSTTFREIQTGFQR